MFPPSCPDYPARPRNREGVYADADEKRHLFLKMKPKSATDIMAIAASVVEFFACGMSLEGVSLAWLRAYSRFFLSQVTSGETITYRRDSSFLKKLSRRPWGEWGKNSLSYMKYLTHQLAWSLKKQDGDCRSGELLIISHRFPR